MVGIERILEVIGENRERKLSPEKVVKNWLGLVPDTPAIKQAVRMIDVRLTEFVWEEQDFIDPFNPKACKAFIRGIYPLVVKSLINQADQTKTLKTLRKVGKKLEDKTINPAEAIVIAGALYLLEMEKGKLERRLEQKGKEKTLNPIEEKDSRLELEACRAILRVVEEGDSAQEGGFWIY